MQLRQHKNVDKVTLVFLQCIYLTLTPTVRMPMHDYYDVLLHMHMDTWKALLSYIHILWMVAVGSLWRGEQLGIRSYSLLDLQHSSAVLQCLFNTWSFLLLISITKFSSHPQHCSPDNCTRILRLAITTVSVSWNSHAGNFCTVAVLQQSTVGGVQVLLSLPSIFYWY